MNPCQSGQCVEVSVTVQRQSTDRERLVVASERLIDRGALRIEVDAVALQCRGAVEVRESRAEAVKDAAHPRARHEGAGVVRGLADQLVRHRRSPLGVGDAPEHMASQGDQLDEFGALADDETSLRRSCDLPVESAPRGFRRR